MAETITHTEESMVEFRNPNGRTPVNVWEQRFQTALLEFPYSQVNQCVKEAVVFGLTSDTSEGRAQFANEMARATYLTYDENGRERTRDEVDVQTSASTVGMEPERLNAVFDILESSGLVIRKKPEKNGKGVKAKSQIGSL